MGKEIYKEKQYDPRKQFSKWLARYGAIFWGIYLLVVAFLIYSKPEAAMACVYLVLIVTGNKMIDTIAYTKNSTTEKIILAMLDKTRMELSLNASGEKKSPHTDTDDSEEESNG